MTVLSSLTNRLFLAMALLAVLSIGAATYYATSAVTAQAEGELRRGLDDAGTLMEDYRRMLFDHFGREAALIADLPRFKATVELDDPPTMRPIAEDYQKQLGADLVLVKNRHGGVIAEVKTDNETGLLDIVTVPVWIDRMQPETLGTLSVGFSLDARTADRFRAITNSEIAFALGKEIRVSSLPAETWPTLATLLGRPGVTDSIRIGEEDYIASTRALSVEGGTAIVLRSRTERLRFLSDVHRRVLLVAFGALLAATLVSYAIARTVTLPLGAITAAMREMGATGDITRSVTLPAQRRWEDEDARLLASTFNSMTDSISRFQREAAQRERLSSLGRLSTVIAHEVRNPLMIIKTALHRLRRPVTPEEIRSAVGDIDEEVTRLNRIVTEVLDFAKPVKFELAPVDLNALCADAARAASTGDGPAVHLELDPRLLPLVTDGERLRQGLVNILANARQAVASRQPTPEPLPIRLVTSAEVSGRVAISVIDRGTGIAPEDLVRIFDPFFTTRRTGTGLGLAITRNIIEGLGGNIAVSSAPGAGTTVRLEFPLVTASV